jgi:large subunit ribosomal protein L9
MKVVLLDDVDNLGEAGDVVNVKGGYARNWLIPQGLADYAKLELLNRIAQIKKRGDEKRLARLSEEKAIICSIDGRMLVIYVRAGHEGRLFGAVTNQTISESIYETYRTRLDRKFIRLVAPIKQLGEFDVELRASSEIKGSLKVIVRNEEDRLKDKAAKAKKEAEKATADVAPAAETSSEERSAEALSATPFEREV